MANLNIQFKDGGNNLYPVTNSDNVVLVNIGTLDIVSEDVNGMTLTEFLNLVYASSQT